MADSVYHDTKVAICTPSTGSVKATYAASLLGMVLYYLQNPLNIPVVTDAQGLYDKVETREITFDLSLGSVIGGARDHMVEAALADKNVTHVLFIDDDMGFEQDCLNVALLRQKPIVLANYRRKAPPWTFTARGLNGDPDHAITYEIETTEDKFDLEEALFGGFGFCLIQRKVFEALPQPRFLQYWVPEQKKYSTEDLPFFAAAREAGYVAYVDHMLSQRVFHVGDYAYGWQAPPEHVKVMRSAS